MTAKTNLPGLFDFNVTREVVKTTALRAFPGWVVKTYRDEYGRETFAADNTQGCGMGPLEPTFREAVHFAKHGVPPIG